jgi:hypothetical protein
MFVFVIFKNSVYLKEKTLTRYKDQFVSARCGNIRCLCRELYEIHKYTGQNTVTEY